MVATQRHTWRPESNAYVHHTAGNIHCGYHGAHCPHLLVVRTLSRFPDTQSLRSCVERRKLPPRCDATAGHPQGEAQVGEGRSSPVPAGPACGG